MNHTFRKYIDIVNETHMMSGHKISKSQANYTDYSDGRDHCGACANFRRPDHCTIVEGYISPEGWCQYFEPLQLMEKWGTDTTVNPKEKGKYAGKTKAELLKSYNVLKKSGPHHKGSPEYGRMRELAFAIRAKGGWGKVKEG